MNRKSINTAVTVTECYITTQVHLQSAIDHLKTITHNYSAGVKDIDALRAALEVIEREYNNRNSHIDLIDMIEEFVEDKVAEVA